MRGAVNLDETALAIEQFFEVATKTKHESLTDVKMESVLIMELSSLAKDIHVKT